MRCRSSTGDSPSGDEKCEHFSLQGSKVRVPGVAQLMCLPAPTCALSNMSVDSAHPGFPPTQFGPDAYPVTSSTCSRHRFLTCCRIAAPLAARDSLHGVASGVTGSAQTRSSLASVHPAIAEARDCRNRAALHRREAHEAVVRARAAKAMAARMLDCSRRTIGARPTSTLSS